MTRHRSGNRRKPKQLCEPNPKPPNILQTNRGMNEYKGDESGEVAELTNIKSLLIDDTAAPKAGTSTSTDDNPNTVALHDELDSFRQRWKRELGSKDSDQPTKHQTDRLSNSNGRDDEDEGKENKTKSQGLMAKEFYAAIVNPPDNPRDVYELAKKLFLMGVQLEQDDMHYESIRYYKQAMHLYPDIERQIFREQSAASTRSNIENSSEAEAEKAEKKSTPDDGEEEKSPLYERISSALSESFDTNGFYYCRPTQKHKAGVKHISDLPHDLLLQIFRYVVGQALDLASLEMLGSVCRGFFLLSRDSSLWRSICYRTWGSKILLNIDQSRPNRKQIDWRQMYLERPRVNFDGIYISRTRYIRQGDVGFQDMTYRPFHVIRYYRYLRFFPDKRVLILTTNEEPERIIPIFRNALHAKQFSPELSILEGSYELINTNQLVIVAEKDFTIEKSQGQQISLSQKRQARFHWSRQTPLSQRFDYKFELKTMASRPYRNNILKWIEYNITSRLETGSEEITEFDLCPDSFPNLLFSRVKTFNLRQTEPLASH
uniref:F-box only protein 9 n=1 Tax=Aceria tosichella TaxID=561515 RepID=A0A6G1SL06_9ACAR